MLRRLRIKFVCIMMSVVMLMLAAVFALVLYFTQQDLARDSIRMLQAAALTYVGALIMALANLARLIALSNRRR